MTRGDIFKIKCHVYDKITKDLFEPLKDLRDLQDSDFLYQDKMMGLILEERTSIADSYHYNFIVEDPQLLMLYIIKYGIENMIKS